CRPQSRVMTWTAAPPAAGWSGLRVRGAALQSHCDIECGRAALDLQPDLVSDVPGTDRDDELVGVGDRATLELEDDVAGTQPGLVGGAVRGDRRLVGLTLAEDLDAFALVLTVEDDADDRMLRLAGADELLDGLAHLVARDREADTDVAAAAARAD